MIAQTNRQTEIYMLSIAGQTTGPIGLTFFVGTHFFKIFFFKFVFLPWATPGPLASIYIIKQDIHIHMLPIAGQTAGPNVLKFSIFFPRATPGPSASNIYDTLCKL